MPTRRSAVGLIYGPSGCGKSSLVKAGLLPRLASHVVPIYVEATPADTEVRLMKGLRKVCPGIPDETSLPELFESLREREKVLPVFEMTDDPEALTQFIFRCRPREVGVDALLDCLQLVMHAPNRSLSTQHAVRPAAGAGGICAGGDPRHRAGNRC